MSVDKLVDSTQLDSDLTSVANAIRTKGGTSAQLAFPNGFVSAIGDIPTGGTLITKTITENGTYSAEDDDADGYSEVTVDVPSGGTYPDYTDLLRRMVSGAFFDDNLLTVGSGAFFRADGITSLHISKATSVGIQAFGSMSGLITAVLPVCTKIGQQAFNSCTHIRTVDFLGNTSNGIVNQAFAGCTVFDKLIIRSASVCKLENVAALNQTRFKSGGAGGTIYIPKSLYDHLGDGSSNDYKAATNWSTINGYGTITWMKIEGSEYETAYADGTPIS